MKDLDESFLKIPWWGCFPIHRKEFKECEHVPTIGLRMLKLHLEGG